MDGAKYILSPGATGDIHTSPLLGANGSKTKFELDKPESLSQEDLEHLYENKYSNMIVKVLQVNVPEEPKTKKVKAVDVKIEEPKIEEKTAE